MKTPEDVLDGYSPMKEYPCYYHESEVINAMEEYAFEYFNMKNAELLSEIEHLKGEQQVLIETINFLTPYKKEGI